MDTHQYLYQDAASMQQWSTDPSVAQGHQEAHAGLYYSPHELDGAQQYVMHAQMPMQSPSPSLGVLTRAQRARVAAEQPSQPGQSLPATPNALYNEPHRSPMYPAHFQHQYPDQSAFLDQLARNASPSQRPNLSLAATPQFHALAGQPALGSPDYPSTPTTVSSAPSSRAYFSTGGRSTSPAVSVASTSLTSLSGGQHASFHPRDAQRAPDCPMDSVHDHRSPASPWDIPSAGAEGISPASGKARMRKTRLDNTARKGICEYAKDHPDERQEDIAALWGVERSTISKILKHKEKWMSTHDDHNRVIKQRPSKFPVLEKRLIVELKQYSRATPPVTLTDQLIRTKAREVAKHIGLTEEKFKASSGWVENFKHRHNIRRGLLVGRVRRRKVGPDGEETGEEESDYEYHIFPGEEGLTKAERDARRAEQKAERMELFKLAEERVMEENHLLIAEGRLDEETRMEMVLTERAMLLRAKRKGLNLAEVTADEVHVCEPHIVVNDAQGILMLNVLANEVAARGEPARPHMYQVVPNMLMVQPPPNPDGTVPEPILMRDLNGSTLEDDIDAINAANDRRPAGRKASRRS